MKIVALLALIATPALAQQQGTLSYACQIDGQASQLIVQYEVIGGSGITTAPNGDISSVISTGDSTIYYQGQLLTPNQHFSFTGENAYADFADLNNNARFRVQFITEGSNLILIVGPFGEQPQRHLCQRNS